MAELREGDGRPTAGQSLVLGALETPTGEGLIDPIDLHVSGWAHARRGAVSRVEVWLDGQLLGRAGLGRPRPDVAAALGEPVALLSGFEFHRSLPAGTRGAPARLEVSMTLLDGTQEFWPAVRVHLKTSSPRSRASPSRRPRPLASLSDRRRRRSGDIRLLWSARGLDLGGSQLRMVELIRHLGRIGGFDITVLCDGEGPLRGAVEDAGASIEIAPRPPLDDIEKYEPAVAEWSRRFEGRFDLVLGWTGTSFPAVEVAGRLRLPAVLRIGESEPLRGVVRWLYGNLDPQVEERARQAFAGAAAVVSVSQAGAKTYRSDGLRGRYIVLPTGVDLEGADEYVASTDSAEHRRKLGIEPGERLMLCAGALWKVKSQALLVLALAAVKDRHPSLTCALMGVTENHYADAVSTFLAQSGLHERVRQLPFCEDLRPWWRAADVAVCASESEALPAAVLEAMAFGLPVLGSRVGDVPLLVAPGVNGWLCDHSDLEAMITAVDEVASSSQAVLRSMGTASRNVASRYERQEYFARWTELLRRAADGRLRVRSTRRAVAPDSRR